MLPYTSRLSYRLHRQEAYNRYQDLPSANPLQTAYRKKAVTYLLHIPLPAKILSCQVSEPHQQVQHCPLRQVQIRT